MILLIMLLKVMVSEFMSRSAGFKYWIKRDPDLENIRQEFDYIELKKRK